MIIARQCARVSQDDARDVRNLPSIIFVYYPPRPTFGGIVSVSKPKWQSRFYVKRTYLTHRGAAYGRYRQPRHHAVIKRQFNAFEVLSRLTLRSIIRTPMCEVGTFHVKMAFPSR